MRRHEQRARLLDERELQQQAACGASHRAAPRARQTAVSSLDISRVEYYFEYASVVLGMRFWEHV